MKRTPKNYSFQPYEKDPEKWQLSTIWKGPWRMTAFNHMKRTLKNDSFQPYEKDPENLQLSTIWKGPWKITAFNHIKRHWKNTASHNKRWSLKKYSFTQYEMESAKMTDLQDWESTLNNYTLTPNEKFADKRRHMKDYTIWKRHWTFCYIRYFYCIVGKLESNKLFVLLKEQTSWRFKV